MDKTERSSLPADYLTSNEYFMGIAHLASKCSKDPVRRVGACIVSEDNKIVGVGYNKMPNGCESFAWGKKKKFFVCHAEMDAIMNKNSADLKNCTIYVTLFPCNECAKLIIQSGIKHIIYSSNEKSFKNKTQASINLLQTAGIQHSKFEHDYVTKFEIDLHESPCIEKSATTSKRQRIEDDLYN